ncbi:uncharacterized protein JCM15063_004927 [Sporobolomyces koalae]|uniref:uncharacterized protein n=1 Tax=Sporobolomyces koalae TaxID=500713 RepID=UPI00316E391C
MSCPAGSIAVSIPPSNRESRSAPRGRRHRPASLDANLFRRRSISSYDDNAPLPPFTSSCLLDVKPFEFDDKQLTPPFAYERRTRRTRVVWYRERRRVIMVFVGFLMVLLLRMMAARSSGSDSSWWSPRSKLSALFGSQRDQSSSSCDNAYAAFGRLEVDAKNPEHNRWRPYDRQCAPPPLLALLRKALRVGSDGSEASAQLDFPFPAPKLARSSLPLPWLHGKTVLLFGDRTERYHGEQFCRLAGGRFGTIGRDHPLSPPRFVNGVDEKLPTASQEVSEASRPSVCHVAEYDLTIVSAFHFGLVNRVEIERETLLDDANFYPPVALEDRLTHIVLPILHSLNRTRPDLIEFSTGSYDLRHFAALDQLANQDPQSDLTFDRLSWYSKRLTRAFADLADVFPHTPILWRSLQHVPELTNAPSVRIAALDALSRQIVKYLNSSETVAEARTQIASLLEPAEEVVHDVSKRDSRQVMRKTYKNRASSKAKFLNRVKQRIGSSERIEEVAFGDESTSLKGMITVDEWATLMRGQEQPSTSTNVSSLPGGYLWSDMMLFFLERLSAPTHFRT